MKDMKLIMEGWRDFQKEEKEKRIDELGPEATAFVKGADAPITSYVPLLKKIADHPEFQAIAAAGKTDAAGPVDEVFKVEPGATKAMNLRASQQEIGFGNSLNDQMTNPAWNPVPAALGLGGEPIEMPCKGERCAILTFAGKYILDGHHRWSQVMMMNPNGVVAIDDLQANDLLQNEEAALKLMQLAIALKAKNVVTKDFEGKDLMDSTAEEVYAFAVENITDEVLQFMVKAGKIAEPNKESAAKYVAGNLAEIQKRKGRFKRGAVMPQASDSGVDQDDVNRALATGAINFDDPNPKDVKE